MKLILGLFVVLLAVALAAKFSSDITHINLLSLFKNPTAKISDQTFKLIIVKTPKEREVGLSDKTSLPSDSGMLFEFDKEGYYPFWMKSMKFPIDILYIRDNKIVGIFQKLQPPKTPEENIPVIRPEEPANKVLEINAGLSEKYSFQKGDEVKIEQ